MINNPENRLSLSYLMKSGTRKEVNAKKCSMPKYIVPPGKNTEVNRVMNAAKKSSFPPLLKYLLLKFSLLFWKLENAAAPEMKIKIEAMETGKMVQ